MSNGPAVIVRRQGFPTTNTNGASSVMSAQASTMGGGLYNAYGGGTQNSYLLTSTMGNKFNSKPGNNYTRPSTSSYQPSMYRSNRPMQNVANQLKNTVVLIHLLANILHSSLFAYFLPRYQE